MERLNVALLLGDVRDIYSNTVVKGALKAATEQNVNLIIVPGRYYFARREELLNQFEYQYQTLFSYCNSENVDVVVAFTNVVGMSAAPGLRNSFDGFYEKLKGAPLYTVSGGFPGIPNINYDNNAGLKEGIRYMIKNQKCQRVAFVAGPKDNDDSNDRIECYKDALVECGLPVDERLIIHGDFTERVRDSVVNLFRSYRDIKGVVFANDRMAIGGYEAMKILGLRVGSDVAFLGFDNINKDVNLEPPLASVGADSEYIGYQAVIGAIEYYKTREVENRILPTQFILRDSIILNKGDKEENKNLLFHVSDTTDFDTFAKQTFEYIFKASIGSKNKEKVYRSFLLFMLHFGKLITSENSASEDDFSSLSEDFNIIFFNDFDNEIDVASFMMVLEGIKESILSDDSFSLNRDLVVRFLAYSFRRLISVMSIRESDKNYSLKKTQHDVYRISADMVDFADCGDSEFARIISKFGIIGIKHSFMYLFKHPVLNTYEDDFMPDEFLYLKAIQCGDEVFSPEDREQMVPVSDMFSRAYSYMNNEGHLLMFALFEREMLYGVMLCDIPYDKFDFYESLIYQVSSSLSILYLLREKMETSRQLNDSLEIIKSNNIRLTTLSESDELTKVKNRRGFLHEAERILRENENNDDIRFVIGYADTDGLKTINDTFGHEMGDEAIIATSNVIKEALGDDGCMGRLGGDEFVVLIKTDKPGAAKRFSKKMEANIERYNSESTNPFILSVSLGLDVYRPNSDLNLVTMLDSADKKMYHIKKKKHQSMSAENK